MLFVLGFTWLKGVRYRLKQFSFNVEPKKKNKIIRLEVVYYPATHKTDTTEASKLDLLKIILLRII